MPVERPRWEHGQVSVIGDLSRALALGLAELIEHAVERAVAESRRPVMLAPEAPRMLTVREACQRLSLSRTSVLDLIYRGELHAHRMHRRGKWLIPSTEIGRWISEQTEEQAS